MNNSKSIVEVSRFAFTRNIELRKYGILFGMILFLGLFFRFSNLDRRMYWHDEAFTSLRISGYSGSEVNDELLVSEVFSTQSILEFQKPGSQKTMIDTVRSLALEDPLHPPFYFIINRLWVELVGYSTFTMRSLTALLSVLALPGMYWLAVELFNSNRTALLATSLMWVSPVFVLIAREARQYMFWIVIALFASAILLRALRKMSKFDWTLYSIITMLGLYTHPLYVFLVFIHSVYVVVYSWSNSERSAFSRKTLNKFFIAITTALIAYIPWILVMINKRHLVTESSQWLSIRIPINIYIQRMIARLSGVFVDLDPFSIFFQGIVMIPVLIIIGISFFYLWYQGPKLSRFLVFLLILTPLVSFILMDTISGGYRSTISRYLVPSFIGFPLLVAFLLTKRIEFSTGWIPKLRLIAIVLLFSLGIVSNFFIVQAESWWDKGSDYGYPQLIAKISDAEKPLLIIDGQRETHFGYMLAFGNELPSHVYIRWGDTGLEDICCQYSDIFVYQPSFDTFEALNKEPEFSLKNVVPGLLWHLE